MGESQLKRLKASLRAAGVTGQQKPKKASKQRKQNAGNDSRLEKNVALQSIREEFNPFELKTNRVKHAVGGRERVKGISGRPGLSKQIGEENRKKTLLLEMQKRNKAGGIVDRRFGENDPTMAPEDRMLERFTREKQKRVRGGELFNLEDDDELTHFGQSLGGLTDDFDAGNNVLLEETSDTESLAAVKKRRLGLDEDDENSDEEGTPERKKTKAEVMKEVIAKSKLHKYERQKTREEDEEEREKLDAQMGDLWAVLGARQPSTTGRLGTGANTEPIPSRDDKEETDISVHPDRAAQIEDSKDREYDAAVREMVFDKRSKPAERTKTEEEKIQEESERLRKLEEARRKRMRGEEDSDEEMAVEGEGDDDLELGDAVEYGFGKGISALLEEQRTQNPDELLDGDYEVSEDGYVDVDENGVINGSETEFSDDFDSDYSGAAGSGDEAEDSEDDEFLADVLPANGNKPINTAGVLDLSKASSEQNDKLAFTFPCPQTHEEMLAIVKDLAVEDLPTVVQRIRVLYHPKLQAENKTKLANLSAVLLEHILHIANTTAPKIPFAPLEIVIRHLHSLAKSYPEKVAEAFRDQLKILHEKRSNTDMNAGDLVLLTAISTIFPTSDHFHAVVTPAMIVIAKWLGQVAPDSMERLAMGTYLVTLCVQYQKLSKRYIPEAINKLLQTLVLLSPSPPSPVPGTFPIQDLPSLRISKSPEWTPRKLSFSDIFGGEKDSKLAILHTALTLLTHLADLWVGKNSFTEVFTPASSLLSHLSTTPLPPALKAAISATSDKISTGLTRSRQLRRPLELHHHRPLPIPSHMPKFEESYSMDKKSYDPDRDRAELAKLKAQHKKERKGALRELRKDSSFIAREKLREDKKNSKEYHEKMRKLTAMIQSEEGAAANEYKRSSGRKK